ncbi:MAG: hypothetical protein AVDCRST_MAG93-2040, partial [uncultured Chloroflexia bacterium]
LAALPPAPSREQPRETARHHQERRRAAFQRPRQRARAHGLPRRPPGRPLPGTGPRRRTGPGDAGALQRDDRRVPPAPPTTTWALLGQV